MAGRENLLSDIPRLDQRSAFSRDKVREKTLLNKNQRIRQTYGFTPTLFHDVYAQEPPEQEEISLAFASRLARREKIVARPNEKVASIAKEQIHTKPAAIANSAIRVDTEFGSGYFPFHSSSSVFSLDSGQTFKLNPDGKAGVDFKKTLKDIKEIYVIQHGVMRNAIDYYYYFKDLYGKDFDPKTMLIIAPQFLAPVDLKGKGKLWDFAKPDEVLRWRYNDWRGAESAMNPNAPIDSFTAMDTLLNHVLAYTPNAERLEFRGNSEGAQFQERYLAYSKTLKSIESRSRNGKPPIRITGITSNAGTAHFFNSLRPVFDKNDRIVKWVEYAFDSPENTWPFGIYDPPPYIIESLEEDVNAFPLETPIRNIISRNIFSIGTADKNPFGSHLPIGPGTAYRAQGKSRLLRFYGKVESLGNIIDDKKKKGFDLPYYKPRTKVAYNFGHSAERMLFINEVSNQNWGVNRN